MAHNGNDSCKQPQGAYYTPNTDNQPPAYGVPIENVAPARTREDEVEMTRHSSGDEDRRRSYSEAEGYDPASAAATKQRRATGSGPAQAEKRPQDGKWQNGLCTSLSAGYCCESWWCTCCQLSRQCNMIKEGKPEIHWGYCCVQTWTSILVSCCLASAIIAFQLRIDVRERYGIRGNACEDCLVGFCCICCATSQIMGEMTLNGEYPGATGCCTKEVYPAKANMR